MIKYKDTYAAKGSALYLALTEGPTGEREKQAAKVYKETTAKYAAMYSKEDRAWFSEHHNKGA